MAPRPDLQATFEALLGSRNVYFQPPENLKMKYPAIVYKRDEFRAEHADNNPYTFKMRYEVTIIDQNPDSVIHMSVARLPTARHNRFFVADNLNHDVYTLFF